MSDERKCYAGDLGTDLIGRLLTVDLGDGLMVTDRVWWITHVRKESSDEVETFIHFERIPDPSRPAYLGTQGWPVDPESEVVVAVDAIRALDTKEEQ